MRLNKCRFVYADSTRGCDSLHSIFWTGMLVRGATLDTYDESRSSDAWVKATVIAKFWGVAFPNEP